MRVNHSPKTEKISETYKFSFNFQESWEVLPYKPSTIWNGHMHDELRSQDVSIAQFV